MTIAEQVSISSSVTVILIVFGLAVLALDVFCIVDIIRRPSVQGGRKWVWILVVCLFELLGPIIYLAVGRGQAPAPEPAQNPAARDRAAAAADLLYGPATTVAGSAPMDAAGPGEPPPRVEPEPSAAPPSGS